MSLLKYSEYILEKKIYELLLESKLVYSKDFINLLNKMKSNRVASELLKLYTKDIDVAQNYIDISDSKDSVSFTPDRKIKELGKEEIKWIIKNSGRHLTHSDRNNRIFNNLGYDKTQNTLWVPPEGTIGVILGETISTTGNTYVLFKELDSDKVCVINKEGIYIENDDEDKKLWNTSRNNIKVGRLARAILIAAKISVSAQEIEQFTNLYKATYDFNKDVLKQFDIVKGEKIAYWYSGENYVGGGGTLNNSCMSDVDSDFFDIYVKNPNQVSLIILYGDEGNINDEGKYTDNEIKGRALLWDCRTNGTKIKFMDRIYTTEDSDEELFEQFAIKNGWWYKMGQKVISNGEETKRDVTLKVHLDESDFEYYPYLDTMYYLDVEQNILSNKELGNDYRYLQETDGSWA